MSTTVVTSQRFSAQHIVPGINEGADRIEVITDYLSQSGILDICTVVEPALCDLSLIELNHSKQYIEDFRRSCEEDRKMITYSASDLDAWYLRNYYQQWMSEDAFHLISSADRQAFRAAVQKMAQADTPIAKDSFLAAQLASGAAVEAAKLVLDGHAQNAFAIVRPPGHHAEVDAALGFCFFNNIAIAARYLLQRGLSKIAIVDWDVHHGNGAQHSFYDDPKVLVCNIHQAPPFYPGFCGYTHETGAGAGEGYNLNIPLAPGSGVTQYKSAISTIVERLKEFKPEFILISNGMDAHEKDPLGGMKLPSDFFGWMTSELLSVARLTCDGRVASILEGGYNREVLPECSLAHVKALVEH